MIISRISIGKDNFLIFKEAMKKLKMNQISDIDNFTQEVNYLYNYLKPNIFQILKSFFRSSIEKVDES